MCRRSRRHLVRRSRADCTCNNGARCPLPMTVTHFSDPGCPWAYSASPALALLRWRFGDQLDWRLVTIGLTEDAERYDERGYTPARMRPGLPALPRASACRSAASRASAWPPPASPAAPSSPRAWRSPSSSSAVFRALQFAQFTTTRAARHRRGPARRAGAACAALDVDAVVGRARRRRRSRRPTRPTARRRAPPRAARPRSRAGGRQRRRRCATPRRRSSSSTEDGRALEVGGFQPLEAYDMVIANLDTSLERRPPAEDVVDVLARAALRADHARGRRLPGRQPRRGSTTRRPRPRSSTPPARAACGARRSATARSGTSTRWRRAAQGASALEPIHAPPARAR